MRTMLVIVLACALSLALAGSVFPANAHEGHTHTPAPSVRPADPPGEQSPLVGALAGVAILVAGLAGIFIYRLIREGL